MQHVNKSVPLLNANNDKLLSGECTIDDCVNTFSNIVNEISSKCFLKTIKRHVHKPRKKAPWFNELCKSAKHDFYQAKRLFKSQPNTENRLSMLNARSTFCNVKKRAKRKYFYNEKMKISDMSKSSPKKFWKYIKKFNSKNKSASDHVSPDAFVNHFSNISNEAQGQFNIGDHNTNRNDSVDIGMLDCPITTEEINKTISMLKRNKSSDIENNVADFFH